MTVPSPWVGVAVVLALTALLVGGVWQWRRRAGPAAELTRKAMHIGMGAIASLLPWLFDRPWPVLALCSGLAAAFLALKLFARTSTLGAAMHDIGRDSRGDIYFALSVAALWLLAGADRLLFLVPVLVLTLGDAVAALVGKRFGRTYFDDGTAGKTLEGSTALFVVAFLTVAGPLVLCERVTLASAAIMATTMALLVTLLEAMAWRGLDNILVPIGTYLLFRSALMLGTSELAWRLAVAIGLVGLVAASRARTTLNDAALAGAALVGYLVWALNGWRWVAALVAFFALYTWVFPRSSGAGTRDHDMHAVGGVTLPVMAWLFLGQAAGTDTFAPYIFTFVAQMAMIGVVKASSLDGPPSRRPILPVILGGAFLMLPLALLVRPWPLVPMASAAALAGAVIAGIGINGGPRYVSPHLQLEQQWNRQALWAFLASLLAAPLVDW